MANSISKWLTGGHHYVEWTNEFNYHVERWTDDDLHIEQVVAICAESDMARAVFDVAVKAYPKKRWLLRIRTMIIKRYVPHGMNYPDQN